MATPTPAKPQNQATRPSLTTRWTLATAALATATALLTTLGLSPSPTRAQAPAEIPSQSSALTTAEPTTASSQPNNLADDPQPQESQPLGRLELEKLQWLLGEWSTPSDAAIPAIAHGKWSNDGQFLLLDYEVSPPGFPKIRSSERIAWDPAAKSYRSWTFRGDGGFGQANWVARDQGWMIRYGGTHGDGRQFSSTLMLAQGGEQVLKLSAIERWVGDEQFPDLVLELRQKTTTTGLATSLEGQVWMLTKLASGPIRGKNRPTLLLENNEIQAFGGINRIGGRYTRDGQSLRLRDLVSTLMGGATADSELEQEFSASLEKVTQFSIEGKTLILSGPNGPLAWLEAQDPSPTRFDFDLIAAHTWEVIELNGQSVDISPPPTLSFNEGNVAGFGGVNQLGGTYNRTDKALTFGPLRATRRAGPAAAMQVEAQFAQILARVDRFDLQDDVLLLLSDNQTVAKLQRQP